MATFFHELLGAVSNSNPLYAFVVGAFSLMTWMFRFLCGRVNKLERLYDELQREFRKEQEVRSRLELIIDRVCRAYEWLSTLVCIIIPLVRAGHPVAEELLTELEKAPKVRDLVQDHTTTSASTPANG